MPGFEHTSTQMPFHPYYLKNIEHYSVLRFMGWQNVNGNFDVNWANRTTPANATLSSAPLEYMIALANQVRPARLAALHCLFFSAGVSQSLSTLIPPVPLHPYPPQLFRGPASYS